MRALFSLSFSLSLSVSVCFSRWRKKYRVLPKARQNTAPRLPRALGRLPWSVHEELRFLLLLLLLLRMRSSSHLSFFPHSFSSSSFFFSLSLFFFRRCLPMSDVIFFLREKRIHNTPREEEKGCLKIQKKTKTTPINTIIVHNIIIIIITIEYFGIPIKYCQAWDEKEKEKKEKTRISR